MARDHRSTSSTQSGETRGYRPFERGYQPASTQVSQGQQSAQKPPKPPTGGTGQSAPRSNSGKGSSN